MNYSPRISANFLLPPVNGLKMNTKLFQENTLPFVPIRFEFLFLEMRLTVFPPIKLNLTWLVALMIVSRSPRELKIGASLPILSSARCLENILHVKLLPLYFFILYLSNWGQCTSHMCNMAMGGILLTNAAVGNREQGSNFSKRCSLFC